jgi:hypothetical protein
MGQAIKTIITDASILIKKEILSIDLIQNIQRRNLEKKDLKVLEELYKEGRSIIQQLENSYDTKKDLEKLVDSLIRLEHFHITYRANITEMDKINRTFYVDNVNQIYFECFKYLYLFDMILRLSLRSEENKILKAFYLSLFPKETKSKIELNEIINKNEFQPEIVISLICDLILEFCPNEKCPTILLDDLSRISDEIKHQTFESSKSYLNDLISKSSNSNEILKKRPETNEIKWERLERCFADFFNLPFLIGDKPSLNEIIQLVQAIKNPTSNSKPAKAFINFFKVDLNKKLFLLFLRELSYNEKTEKTVIPMCHFSSFAKSWHSLNFDGMKRDTVNNYLGNKEESRGNHYQLNKFHNRLNEIKHSIESILNNCNSTYKYTESELTLYLKNIFLLCK